MKGLLLIAIAFLVQTVIAVNEINETSFVAADACPAKYIVAPKCAQYYECSKGKKVLKDCEDGLYFSKKWQVCVKPAVSGCDPLECDEDRLYPHECQCDKFYECKNNRKVLYECKPGECFNEDRETCIKGDCNEEKTCIPAEECECEEGEYLPHECKCNKYYECKNCRKVLRECKKGYNFHEDMSKCIKGPCPWNCTEGKKKSHDCECELYYKCTNNEWILEKCEKNEHFSPTDRKCMNKKDARCELNCEENKLYPHECKCDKFYECKNNELVLHECKSGECFGKVSETCIPGSCKEETCKPVDCECKDGDYLPHEYQCTKYYDCKNNRKVLRNCKKGYYFDTKKCKKGTCPEKYATCPKGAKKSHDCSCEKYYTCTNKNWILQKCNKNQHFSPTLLKCTTKKAARCEEQTTEEPPTTESTTEEPEPEPGVCPKNVPTRWSHECDCRLYYECKKKEKILQTCAWGRYFDHVNQVCEKASKVSTKCKNSWDNWV